MNANLKSLLWWRASLVAKGQLVAKVLAKCDERNECCKRRLGEVLSAIKWQKIRLAKAKKKARLYDRSLSSKSLCRKVRRIEAKIKEIDRLIGGCAE